MIKNHNNSPSQDYEDEEHTQTDYPGAAIRTTWSFVMLMSSFFFIHHHRHSLMTVSVLVDIIMRYTMDSLITVEDAQGRAVRSDTKVHLKVSHSCLCFFSSFTVLDKKRLKCSVSAVFSVSGLSNHRILLW